MSYTVNGYLANPNHAITITVIGCGGTGSLLIPRLAKMNFALKHLNNHPGFHVKVYDFDKIEYNNVGRQNFFEPDIGDYKSVNIIEKCNIAYGTNWEAEITEHNGVIDSNIVFTCVDDIKVREFIHDRGRIAIKKERTIYDQGLYWIDCGNGKDFGQVVLSDLYDNKLKDVFDIFSDYKNQDPADQKFRGCSYIEKFEEQELFINDFIATEAVDLFWRMIRTRTIDSQGVIINQNNFKKQPLKI